MPQLPKSIHIIAVMVVVVLLFETRVYGQLTVTSGVNATTLAQTLAGPGITVSNATLTGAPQAAGTFDGSASNIGVNSGVILCSGSVTLAPGPNNAGNAGQNNGQPGNSQLNSIANATTYDAVVLEFDFVPLSNTIEFDYIFGSEEYPEWVNSSFNDAFAFFISGPGIAGEQNIALVPNTTTPVTINTINGGTNNQFYINNTGGATVQYDGFTTVLTASSAVQACETYHLKLMIADGGDGIWDSGVFLAEGSLTSAVVQITTTTATADSTAYENCSSATVTFTLSETLSTPYTVNYTISGTATNGVDFPTIPTSVTIPPNTLSTSFLIEPVYDGITEGIETVILDVQTSVCGTDTILVFIDDVTPVTVQAFGDTAFCGGTAKLWVSAQGGGGSHTFQWSDGSTTDTIFVSPTSTTTYTVSANDYCASTVPAPTASATVTIDPTPTANAGPDFSYCAGDAVTLSGSDGSAYQWFDLTNNTPVGTSATVTLHPSGDVDYRMITLNGTCSDTDFVSITELPASPASATGDTAFCEGGTAQLDVTNAAGGSFVWTPIASLSNPFIQNPTATPNSTTVYYVTITTSSGCVKTDSVLVTIEPSPIVNYSVDDVCLNQPSQFTNLTTISSGAIQSMSWNFGNGNTSTDYAPTTLYTSDGTYSTTLVATSASGCVDSVSQTTTIHPLPTANFSFIDDCADKQIPFTDQSAVTTGSTISTWHWDFGNGTTSTQQQPAAQTYPAAGNYTITLAVETAFGCTDDTSIALEVFPVPTANFTFDSVCLGVPTQFTDLSSANGNYPISSWNWSFSNSLTATSQNPAVTFSSHGFYTTTLSIATTAGCVSTATRDSAVVHPLPISQFSNALKNCLGDTTWFQDLSAVPNLLNDSITTWHWNFSDGNSDNHQHSNHLFTNHGFHPVTLITQTNKGCADTTTNPVEIFPLPVIHFASEVLDGCQPLRVQFEQLCSIPSPYSIAYYEWNLGVTNDAIQNPNPIQVYNNDTLHPLSVATYPVSLQATSANGCVSSDTVQDYITEYPKPKALFAATPYVVDFLDTEVQFTDKSSENVTDWYYEFGDGGTSYEQHPTNYYPEQVGSYTATQYVTTAHNCSDTAAATIKVEPIFTFYIPSAFTPNQDGVNEYFFGDGEGFSEYNMHIYDRWGEEIFVSNHPDLKWDGTFKGQQVPQGTYIYYFYILDWKNNDHEYRGRVTLTR